MRGLAWGPFALAIVSLSSCQFSVENRKVTLASVNPHAAVIASPTPLSSFTPTPSPSPTASPTSTPTITPSPSSSPSYTPSPSPTPTPTPTSTPSPTPSPTPTPSPVGGIIDTKVFLAGSGNYIQSLVIDHSDDTVAKLDLINVPFEKVGRIQIDAATNTFLAVENEGLAGFFKGILNLASGVVGSTTLKTGVASGGYSTLVRTTLGKNFLYVSDYHEGKIKIVSLGAGFSTSELIDEINFTAEAGTNANTYSTSYDPVRKWLFVAHEALNKIDVLSVNQNTGALGLIGSIPVTTPRTVVYDTEFERLYVVTEILSAPSYFYGFSLAWSGLAFSYSEVAKVTLGKRGGDLRIDRVHRYALATVREAGNEAVWGIPLTSTGLRDTSRSVFTIPIGRADPRAVDVTEDGKYITIATDSSSVSNIIVRKMNYNADLKFTSSTLLFESLVGNGFRTITSIPRR